uniref:Uncharacterized protein n=1 Tax=Gallus gallus TaxID=9031 RepID=A0A8V0X6Y9_CHICK
RTSPHLLHMPPSPGCGLPLCQHSHICLSEVSITFLPIPEPGGGSVIHSGTSSHEPHHLQHEEPGDQASSQDTVWRYIASASVKWKSSDSLYVSLPLCCSYGNFTSNKAILRGSDCKLVFDGLVYGQLTHSPGWHTCTSM